MNDSFWSLHNPSSSRSPTFHATTQRSSTESDASLPCSFDSVTLPNARPSNRPIMGTSLYGSHTADRPPIQRSPSQLGVSAGSQRALSKSPMSSYNPMYVGLETQRPALISVQTQTIRLTNEMHSAKEEVTELDDTKRSHLTSTASFALEKRPNSRPQRRHTYINLLDEFDGQVKRLGQW